MPQLERHKMVVRPKEVCSHCKQEIVPRGKGKHRRSNPFWDAVHDGVERTFRRGVDFPASMTPKQFQLNCYRTGDTRKRKVTTSSTDETVTMVSTPL